MTSDPIWEMCTVLKNRTTHKGEPTNTCGQHLRRATSGVLLGASRPAKHYVCRHRLSDYHTWGVLGGWCSPEATRGQQRRGYIDRASARSLDLVGARVAWEEKREGNRGLRRTCDLVLGAAGGLPWAKGRGGLRGDCFGDPAYREWRISPLR